MTTAWDPAQYLRFADERSRPFAELLARVGADPAAVSEVLDLGCGPGALTASLCQRYPRARVTGVDHAPSMIAAAARDHADPRLRFVVADLRAYAPEALLDVLVTNATLHWLPEHLALLPSLVGLLRPGGWLAFQVPGNLDGAHHQAIAAVCHTPRWADRLGDAPNRALVSHELADYAAALAPACDHLDLWATEYLHLLQGADPVLEWVKGTSLRPVLARLDPAEQSAFCAELSPLLRAAYPAQSYGTPFPFRRHFIVARRA